MPKDFCPYKGLQPYTEGDRAFFFGRERDAQVIISNLYAAQLTVFYGASGVGKSSVLLAGAVPLLKQERNVSVVVFRNWQDPNFLSQLKQCTLEAASGVAGKQIEVDLSLSLDEFLSSLQRTTRGLIFFIFDQFEEYFLYNPIAANAVRFEGEFAQAVNRRDLSVNFLVSMREDGLSKLDRFQSRIPTLMSNMLRLEHLDRAGAKAAIVGPLEVYNQQLPEGQAQVTIEDPLVKTILNDLRGVKVTSEQTGEGALQDSTPGSSTAEIETPLLQMVLTRLWDEERHANSNVLRLETFEKLGRAANIVRTHLDTVMARLNDAERDEAADVLRYMVTPSGSKIAQETSALASWSELPEAKVQTVLDRLGAPDMRIVRTIQAPEQPVRYEIFHDVLAQAILSWRRVFVTQQNEERIRSEEQERIKKDQAEKERRLELERARRLRKAFAALVTIVVIMAAQMVYAFWQRQRANNAGNTIRTLQTEIDRKRVDLEAAQKNLSQARDVADHMRLGQLFVQQRDYADALKEFDQVMALDPNNPNAYNQKGYAYLRSGNYEEAENNLKRASELDSNFVWGHYNLALTYWAEDKKDDAVKEVEAVIRIRPDFRKIIMKDGQFKKFNESPDYIKLIESTAQN